jgi:hypothetical protein
MVKGNAYFRLTMYVGASSMAAGAFILMGKKKKMDNILQFNGVISLSQSPL